MAKKDKPMTGYATCGSCQYWQRMDGEEVGECYFNPPVCHVDEEGFISIRPILEPDERACGHFKGAQ